MTERSEGAADKVGVAAKRPSFFAELKRRNVFRVALFYVVAAWVVVQVAETVLPVFEVPDSMLRGLVILLALGFVPAVVLAWAFEWTPDGIAEEILNVLVKVDGLEVVSKWSNVPSRSHSGHWTSIRRAAWRSPR